MRLPGVSLPSTPVCGAVFCTAPPQRRRYLVTPLALPFVCPASVPLSVSQCGPRVDPLHPPSSRRRTVSLETLAAHHNNQQRTLVMQQKEYCRFHQGWQRPFYGSRAEKEEYRKEVRELLKRQMLEKWEEQRHRLANRVQEAEPMFEADRLALSREMEQNRSRARALSHYRDENKRLMEEVWRDRAVCRSLEALRERELLQYNPLNWSGTLK
ncbi:differentially expressed in FDCP 6-like [Amia ocellicauda]|uniref:differentially expressed in FDCP 6-like n=1 Tax=Amia ocellicauda TaxID=2972642 RepID=UPI003463CF1A